MPFSTYTWSENWCWDKMSYHLHSQWVKCCYYWFICKGNHFRLSYYVFECVTWRITIKLYCILLFNLIFNLNKKVVQARILTTQTHYLSNLMSVFGNIHIININFWFWILNWIQFNLPVLWKSSKFELLEVYCKLTESY